MIYKINGSGMFSVEYNFILKENDTAELLGDDLKDLYNIDDNFQTLQKDILDYIVEIMEGKGTWKIAA